MPRRGGSGHYMSMTGHREAYHGACICCANHRRLQTYFDGEYYCSSCRKKFSTELRKAKLLPEQNATEEGKAAMLALIENLVEKRRRDLAGEEKTTRRDVQARWKPKRKP